MIFAQIFIIYTNNGEKNVKKNRGCLKFECRRHREDYVSGRATARADKRESESEAAILLPSPEVSTERNCQKLFRNFIGNLWLFFQELEN